MGARPNSDARAVRRTRLPASSLLRPGLKWLVDAATRA
eukprot:CAMPEP_0203905066 /NCGR_PEP_ID=MMETSP0359-20131031/46796_1 /ASSEMBLY_ACC=CAM_ASM_000338 /TAXON_ID=268821 /ORGANISM="Scrippsiella Hangoei, Strain SHTV-5" /LENGTH=37 /DNA_ID= /DNA_START= /DNA_END= /DNA_ORIENTATION=